VPVSVRSGGAEAKFTIAEGQTVEFTLQHGHSRDDPPAPLDIRQALLDTQSYWRDWIGHSESPAHSPDAVRRSLLTLNALTDGPIGGLLAAPTTSLLEKRVASATGITVTVGCATRPFTISALLNAGYHEEAGRWRDWVLRAVAGMPAELRIPYRIDGGRHANEWTVDWLPGYRWSRRVRGGNAAAAQRQVDVLGEVLDTMALACRAGLEATAQEAHVAHAIAEASSQCGWILGMASGNLAGSRANTLIPRSWPGPESTVSFVTNSCIAAPIRTFSAGCRRCGPGFTERFARKAIMQA
jgi:GH15 family glucan-1,4-alpha-glucosidase